MKPSIFIVDDDALYKLLLKKSLKKLPYEIMVNCYDNGEEALLSLQKLKTQKELLPDIILLDINMPVMDGWDFLDAYKKIKTELSKPINIYMASSSIAANDLEKAKHNSDVLNYLVKPISLSKIHELFTSKTNAQLQTG